MGLRNSVHFKFAAVFLMLMAVLLVFLNTYPMMMTRDLAFTSKQGSMQNQASVMALSLSTLEALSPDGVTRVMELIDVMAFSRVIVTNEAGIILYDTSDSESSIGDLAEFPELALALDGNQVFFSRFTGDAFLSCAAMPVMSRSETIGAVYLYERDDEQAGLIKALRMNLHSISIVVGVFAVILTLFFTRALGLRIRQLVAAIQIVRDGAYDYRIVIKGNDEIAELGEEFNTLTDRLQSTEEIRRRFVSDASHELRTPLAAIRLLSDSILQSGGMDTETMLEFVSDIGSEAERLQRTAEKLLALTKLSGDNEAVAEIEKVDVGRVAEKTVHLLTPLAAKINVRLEYTLEEDCFIYASEDDIYQIIFNLAENGIKYNIPGGLVRMSLYRSDGCVLLDIEDTGIGIPAEDLPYIFDRFYRVDKARSREAGGSGLGLSIVRDAVLAHGGEIGVVNRDGGGARFEVSFPEYSEDNIYFFQDEENKDV